MKKILKWVRQNLLCLHKYNWDQDFDWQNPSFTCVKCSKELDCRCRCHGR